MNARVKTLNPKAPPQERRYTSSEKRVIDQLYERKNGSLTEEMHRAATRLFELWLGAGLNPVRAIDPTKAKRVPADRQLAENHRLDCEREYFRAMCRLSPLSAEVVRAVVIEDQPPSTIARRQEVMGVLKAGLEFLAVEFGYLQPSYQGAQWVNQKSGM